MPPGTTPPFIIRYSASNVPILQVALQSDSLSEKQLFDFGTNFIRADIATIPGAMLPWPYGGKQRQIMVDIDPSRLWSFGLSPRDVTNAIAAQNVILPAGTAKMGDNEYPVVTNSSPEAIHEIGDMPIKTVGDTTVYVRDVADVHDGYSPQTNMVHVEGHRSVLMSILKHGNSSTLEVVSRIRTMLPSIAAKLPKELKTTLLFDQSLFVRAAVEGVAKEAAIAAGLTALMILLFLGSWRATLVVVISIPLSILVSIIVLYALGQTLNVMTLGGHVARGRHPRRRRHRRDREHPPQPGPEQAAGPRHPRRRAGDRGARAFVSTLCICIVFIPVVLITGAARSLFIPLAMAVVFAMLTSYLLSRTLVPTLVRYLLRAEVEHGHHGPSGNGLAARFYAAFDRGFERLRLAYGRLLALVLTRRGTFIGGFSVFVVLSLGLYPMVGRDFFPSVDAGLIKLHVRGPPGTRIEETEKRVAAIEDTIRTVIPKSEIETMIDILGTPYSGLNLSLSEGALISPADGQILIALKEDHPPTPAYVRSLRKLLPEKYPDTTFFFLAPDISTQVLNFGLPAPIDVQIVSPPGGDEGAFAVAEKFVDKMRAIPGAVDVHIAQVRERPELRVDVDRTMASAFGLKQTDVAERSPHLAGVEHPGAAHVLARLQVQRPVPRRRADAAARERQHPRARLHAPLPGRRGDPAAPLQRAPRSRARRARPT